MKPRSDDKPVVAGPGATFAFLYGETRRAERLNLVVEPILPPEILPAENRPSSSRAAARPVSIGVSSTTRRANCVALRRKVD